MEQWKRDARREPIIVDLDTLVPKDHLLRKIEKVMDYDGCMSGLTRTIATTTDGPAQIRSF